MMNRIVNLIILVILYCGCDPTSSNKNNADGDELELVWSFEYLNAIQGLSSISNAPTILPNSTVLIAIDAAITSLDIDSGSIKWRYELGDNVEYYPENVLFDESRVYLTKEKSKNALALNLFDGQIIWEDFSIEEEYRYQQSEIQSNSRLYLNGSSQNIYEFSKEGEYLRRISFEYSIRSGHYVDGNLIMAQAYRDDEWEGNQNFANGRIFKFDLEKDSVIWEYNTNSGGYYYSPILLESDTIFGGATEGLGDFVALDQRTGEVLWNRANQETWAYTIGQKKIFINDGSALVALDKENGNFEWRTSFPGGGFAQSNVAYLNGFVYHSHSGSLYVLDAETGEIVHSVLSSPDGSQFYNLSIGFGKVFVQSDLAIYCYKIWDAD